MTEQELKEIERMLEQLYPGTLTRLEVIRLVQRMLRQAEMSQESKEYKRALLDVFNQVTLYGASAR